MTADFVSTIYNLLTQRFLSQNQDPHLMEIFGHHLGRDHPSQGSAAVVSFAFSLRFVLQLYQRRHQLVCQKDIIHLLIGIRNLFRKTSNTRQTLSKCEYHPNWDFFPMMRS